MLHMGQPRNEATHSVTNLLHDLHSDNRVRKSEAKDKIHKRYFDVLIERVQKWLIEHDLGDKQIDAEAVAALAFEEFFEDPSLAEYNRGSFQNYLARIGSNKAIDAARKLTAKKNGGGT